MKKLRKLGFYCTFILFLSGILTVLLLSCKDSLRETSDIDIVNQENENIDFVHHPCLIISSRDVTLHANCENKNFTHDRFLAYRGDFNRGNTETNFSLKSPFPSGCRIVEIRRESKTLHLTLDGVFAQLENLDLTLACACLAKTCFDMSDAQEVKIDAVAPDGNSIINITFNRDSLVLEDNSVLPSQVEAEDHQ